MQKPAVTQVSINETIANRWSPRAFDANKPVAEAEVTSLLEAARWAPSCFGDQPWRLVVWDKNTDESAWQQVLENLSPGNQTWAKNAPILILVCADTKFTHNGEPNRWGRYDAGAAAENLCLQATSLGLVSHQMGGFDTKKLREIANVPEQFELMAMMAIGYPGRVEDLPEDVQARELAERKRRGLGELFFKGVWNQPIL